MFIRFVIHSNDIDSGRKRGLFKALDLETRGLLMEHEVAARALLDETEAA
jgi:hypothetical protein